MNNLKFRIWDLDKKTWRNSYEFAIRLNTTDPNEQVLHAPMIFGGYGAAYGNYEINQWTGLQDKNGRDIYVGDIVEFEGEPTYTANKVELWRKEVVFSNRGFFGMNRGDSDKYPPHLLYPYATVCEVIGNIYENPELLNP